MLRVGQQRVFDCQRWARRELLRVGAISVAGLSLADWLRLRAGAQDAPRAKAVILLWLWGGPSHLDTFDLKPKAPGEYRGPYAPISTNVAGIEICELLPELARRADRYALLRAVHHSNNDHGIAGTIGLTGSDAGATSLGGQLLPGELKPTHGAIVTRALGFEPTVPRFVTVGGNLHQGKRKITGEGGGSLGGLYDPFRVDYDPLDGVKVPQLELADGYSPSGLDARERLRGELNRLTSELDRSARIERLDQYYQQAYSLLTSSQSRRVLGLDDEPEPVRERYGRFRFGQCCLLARRLIEAGVRFVQVNWSSHVEGIEDAGDGGWDMHDRYFHVYQERHAWMLDQSVSALLDDLADRGLLDETIVIATGEFGRTPKINPRAGRDHWNQCYSALVAGGGCRVGQVIGASDRRGEFPLDRPVTPADLFTTVLDQIGIGTTALTSMGLTPLGRRIDELV